MKENQIALVIKGHPRRGGVIRSTDFLSSVSSFLGAASRMARIMGIPKGALEFRVISLSQASPARMVFELAATEQAHASAGPMVLAELVESLERVRSGSVSDEDMDPILLDGLKALASPIGRGLESERVEYAKKKIALDNVFAEKLRTVLAPETSSQGFVRGMLEAINIHHSANTFRLYPDVGPPKISCYFPERLLADAISGVGRYVEISGLLSYRPQAKFPHEIAVENIEVFPPEDQLPALDEIFGIAPSATGSKSSEEFVRDIRDEED